MDYGFDFKLIPNLYFQGRFSRAIALNEVMKNQRTPMHTDEHRWIMGLILS
jgi:hypothetical protein